MEPTGIEPVTSTMPLSRNMVFPGLPDIALDFQHRGFPLTSGTSSCGGHSRICWKLLSRASGGLPEPAQRVRDIRVRRSRIVAKSSTRSPRSGPPNIQKTRIVGASRPDTPPFGKNRGGFFDGRPRTMMFGPLERPLLRGFLPMKCSASRRRKGSRWHRIVCTS